MRYELIHDSIAKQVFEKASTDARARRKIEKDILEAHEAFKSRGARLTKEDVDYYEPYLGIINVTPQQHDFILHAKDQMRIKRNYIRVIIVVVIFVVIALFIWAFGEKINGVFQYEEFKKADAAVLKSDSISIQRTIEAENATKALQDVIAALRQSEMSDSTARAKALGIAETAERKARQVKKKQ